MIKSPIQFVYVCVCRNTQKKLRFFERFVDFKFKFCCEFRSWMFLNHSKWITSCFDGLNIPSYLAYSTFLVITNFYGLRCWFRLLYFVDNKYLFRPVKPFSNAIANVKLWNRFLFSIDFSKQRVEDVCIVLRLSWICEFAFDRAVISIVILVENLSVHNFVGGLLFWNRLCNASATSTPVFVFKGIIQPHSLNTSIMVNKYVNPLFSLENICISTKSAAQMSSTFYTKHGSFNEFSSYRFVKLFGKFVIPRYQAQSQFDNARHEKLAYFFATIFRFYNIDIRQHCLVTLSFPHFIVIITITDVVSSCYFVNRIVRLLTRQASNCLFNGLIGPL